MESGINTNISTTTSYNNLSSIIEKDEQMNGYSSKNAQQINENEQPFSVGYLSRSPRGGENGEVLSDGRTSSEESRWHGSLGMVQQLPASRLSHSSQENGYINQAYDENDNEVHETIQYPEQENTAHNRRRINSTGSLDLNSSISSTASQLTERRKGKQRLQKFRGATRQVSAHLLERQKKDLEVHIIDKIARYVYPISFIIYNVVYFTYAFVHRYSNHWNS